jgi:plasmid stabilization system protein ParE
VTRLLVAKRADTQIRTIDAWWIEHRDKAPGLFAQELANTLEAIADSPTVGRPYGVVGGVEVRRLLLRRCRYHVYFSYDAASDLVRVRAVWHSSRGRPPLLR